MGEWVPRAAVRWRIQPTEVRLAKCLRHEPAFFGLLDGLPGLGFVFGTTVGWLGMCCRPSRTLSILTVAGESTPTSSATECLVTWRTTGK